jgi:multidrug resistance efflux pump
MSVAGGLVEEQNSPIVVTSGGRVLSARFPVGSFVQQEAVILEIDSTEYDARLQQAKANEVQALSNLRDAQSRLFQQPGKPFDPELQPGVVTSKQQYEAAQEQSQLAQNNLERYRELRWIPYSSKRPQPNRPRSRHSFATRATSAPPKTAWRTWP